MNSARKAGEEIAAPSLLPCLKQRGLGEFLDGALADIIWEHRDNIHEIVDAVIARHKRAAGKGGSKAMRKHAGAGGGGGSGPAHIHTDPKVEPAAATIRHMSITALATRSHIEPITERIDSAMSVADLFAGAARECCEAVDAIVAKCQRERKMFFDESFYFDKRRNLYPAGSPDDCTVTQPYKCARLRDLLPNAPMFTDDLACDDVLQGSVGDCFLIGAMSALAATNPGKLKRLFAAFDVECGVYGVCFFKCGGWEWVIVDDTVPVHQERSGFCFPQYACHGDEEELWPIILEKAYAKLHYNWDTIDGGFAKEALVDLTGGLDYTYDLHREDSRLTFQEFKVEVDDKYTILGCAVGDHVEPDATAVGCAGEHGAVNGLFHGHQYSVTGAVLASDGTGFVKVRNPWGGSEWTGPYSDNSDDWKRNPRHFEEVRPSFGEDGTFWMRWEDFRSHMTEVDVVRMFPDHWKVLTMFGTAENTACPRGAFILQVCGAKTRLAITYSQDDPKVIHTSDNHEKQYALYNAIKLSIYKLRAYPHTEADFDDALGCKFDCVKGRERAVYNIEEFEPGLYCVTPLMSKGEHQGMFLRVLGPQSANYALWNWAKGEATRQVVGSCPLQSARGGVAGGGHRHEQRAGDAATTPPAPPAVPRHVDIAAAASPVRGPPSAAASPPAAAPARANGSAAAAPDAAPDAAIARDLADAQSYIRQLEKLLEKQQAQLDAADAAVHSQPPSAPPAQSTTPQQRLGLTSARFDEVVGEVFEEVAAGSARLDRKAALSALRLIVTLGAGMDDVALGYLDERRLHSLDLRGFRAMCAAVVGRWPVLQ